VDVAVAVYHWPMKTNIPAQKLSMEQQQLSDLWDEHVRNEFLTKDPDGALRTMIDDAYVNHVPVLTGGVGRTALHAFYASTFIAQLPADTKIIPVSRTVGTDRLIDEMVVHFTHTIPMDWMLPGVTPTGRRVECALVAVVQFENGKMVSERIYWDQASVLVQLGLLDPSSLPVAGAETARKVLDPEIPSNLLMNRGTRNGYRGV
jgi:carboxymethylenebutenolidase